MVRMLYSILTDGIIDGFIGLANGEEVRIIPFGLVRKGILNQTFADWLYDNEPLTERVVLVVACDGNTVVKHRAAFDVEFGEPVRAGSDKPGIVPGLPPRHPECLPG